MLRALLMLVALAGASPAARVQVGPTVWRPTFPPEEGKTEIPVPAFLLDPVPVSNAAFLTFVKANPAWQRERVSALFADEGYLRHWEGPISLGSKARPDQPVIGVSWFAARAYCEAQGARLPTTAEWEVAANADETRPDASQDPAWRDRILAWYAQPSTGELGRVGQGAPNYWGAYDLTGLVWEWTEDFNSTLVSGDSRERKGADKALFCGAGALEAQDKGDYAAFMRVAFRASLSASYTTANLGFRCAKDLEKTKP